MKNYRLIAVLLSGALLTACGKDDVIDVDCDEGQEYQNSAEARRITIPEGLDALDEFAEMPIPRADPNATKTAEGRCTDMPPPIGTGTQ